MGEGMSNRTSLGIAISWVVPAVVVQKQHLCLLAFNNEPGCGALEALPAQRTSVLLFQTGEGGIEPARSTAN
jgi:hypothetical protein